MSTTVERPPNHSRKEIIRTVSRHAQALRELAEKVHNGHPILISMKAQALAAAHELWMIEGERPARAREGTFWDKWKEHVLPQLYLLPLLAMAADRLATDPTSNITGSIIHERDAAWIGYVAEDVAQEFEVLGLQLGQEERPPKRAKELRLVE